MWPQDPLGPVVSQPDSDLFRRSLCSASSDILLRKSSRLVFARALPVVHPLGPCRTLEADRAELFTSTAPGWRVGGGIQGAADLT